MSRISITTIAFLATLSLLIALPSQARPRKGFHSGPYLALEVGISQEDFDRDQVTGQNVGRDWESAFGFIFGWNIWDSFSAELQGRYTTNLNKGRRAHLANANFYGKYTFISNTLTDFERFRILPFVKGGLAVKVEALPGTPGATHNTAIRTALGPAIGGGLSFLWNKYLYFGIDAQEEFLFFGSIHQTVGATPDLLVYRGGFHPSFCAMGMIGVHY